MSVLGGKPGANDPEVRRIKRHIDVLRGMIAETKADYLALKRDILSTPTDDVTLGQKGELQLLKNKVDRLQAGFGYWNRILAEKLKPYGIDKIDPGPGDAELTKPGWEYKTPNPWPKGGGGVVGPVEPAPASVLPPRVGTVPDSVCGMPPNLTPKARDAWISHNIGDAWNVYLRDLWRAETHYDSAIQKWHVDLYYWNLRRKKTEASGQEFAEKRPDKPHHYSVKAPKCRPALQV